MIIPKTIKVGSTQYKVLFPKEIHKPEPCRGFVSYLTNVIALAKGNGIFNYTKKQKEETFWHEVTHAILYDMDNDLYKNEKFVTEFSTRLNNAIRSAKF